MTSTISPANPAPVEAREAPLWLFPVADLTYQRKVYGLRSYRLVLAECGHLVQNVLLVATALGLPAIPIGGFFDDLLSHTLGIDGVHRAALYMIPIGGRTP
jgi:SagB-type dehydrogenase family enzyme